MMFIMKESNIFITIVGLITFAASDKQMTEVAQQLRLTMLEDRRQFNR